MAVVGSYDHATALKEFSESRAGVRGLIESGITTVPPLFRNPEAFIHHNPAPSSLALSIPTIDLSLPRPLIIDLVRDAARKWGFFQVINHGIPLATIDRAISTVRSFHEQPSTVRSKIYSREPIGGVSYYSYVDKTNTVNWRDTLQMHMGPIQPDLDRVPMARKEDLLTWHGHAKEFGRALSSILSEGLGLGPETLEDLMRIEGAVVACHYYPPCPAPDQTMGTVGHTDPSVFTMLVQDGVGGLQIKHEGEDGNCYWVDVVPVPGALVINIGDILKVCEL